MSQNTTIAIEDFLNRVERQYGRIATDSVRSQLGGAKSVSYEQAALIVSRIRYQDIDTPSISGLRFNSHPPFLEFDFKNSEY